MAMLNNQRVYNSQLDGLQPYTKMRKKKPFWDCELRVSRLPFPPPKHENQYHIFKIHII